MTFLDTILNNRDVISSQESQPKRAPWNLGDVSSTGATQVGGMKAAFDLQRIGVQGRPKYPDIDVASLLTAYQRNELVYAAINAKASTAIDPRLLVQARASKDEWGETEGHPMRRLLMEPNEAMDEAQLLAAYIIALDTTGRYVEEIVRGPNGLPVQLHPLNPSKLGKIQRADGKFDWEFKDGSDKVRLKAEDVLVKELWNPGSKHTPLAPLAVAMGSVDADNAQTDYLRAFFNNGGVPSGILKFQKRITQPEADQAKARWKMGFNRAFGTQNDIVVLDETTDYQKVGANLDELSSEAIRTFTESRLTMAFGVPPLIIYAYAGLLRSDYSNLKIAWKMFADFTLSPLLKGYRNWRARTLLPQFVNKELVLGERVRLFWDLSECAWAQDDVTEVANRAREDFKAGGITLNQFLAARGYPPDKDGDYYVRSVALASYPADMMPDRLDELVSTGGDGDTQPAKNRARKARQNQQKATRQALEKKLEKKLHAYLMKDITKVAAIVGSAA